MAPSEKKSGRSKPPTALRGTAEATMNNLTAQGARNRVDAAAGSPVGARRTLALHPAEGPAAPRNINREIVPETQNQIMIIVNARHPAMR